MSVSDEKFDELTARVAALEGLVEALTARVPSPGRMALHGPILPPPMPPHVAMDPIGALRAEIARLRKMGVTWDSAWDRLDLTWVQKGQTIYAQSNQLRTHGFRDFVEKPLRQEAA
jgi:hypothetical protein